MNPRDYEKRTEILSEDYRRERALIDAMIRLGGYDPGAIIWRARVSNWVDAIKQVLSNLQPYRLIGLRETTRPQDSYRTYVPTSALGEVICCRCHVAVTGSPLPDGGMTAGYYDVRGSRVTVQPKLGPDGWADYANPGEQFVCDACMWSDPDYIEIYGLHPVVASYTAECRHPLTDSPCSL